MSADKKASTRARSKASPPEGTDPWHLALWFEHGEPLGEGNVPNLRRFEARLRRLPDHDLYSVELQLERFAGRAVAHWREKSTEHPPMEQLEREAAECPAVPLKFWLSHWKSMHRRALGRAFRRMVRSGDGLLLAVRMRAAREKVKAPAEATSETGETS